MVKRIMNAVSLPAVVTSAVPTTEEIAMTSDVNTDSNALPCIQVVAVVEPETVFVSMANEAASAPL
jgi:hypothetical protein